MTNYLQDSTVNNNFIQLKEPPTFMYKHTLYMTNYLQAQCSQQQLKIYGHSKICLRFDYSLIIKSFIQLSGSNIQMIKHK